MFEHRTKGLLISTDKDKLVLDYVYHYLSKISYWSQNLPHERFMTAVTNSLCYGLYQDEQQIGFARVVTDFSEFASLWDVFIDPDHQRQGLGKLFVKTIFSSPLTKDVFKWFLMTGDAHGLYKQFDFTDKPHPAVMTKIAPANF